MLRIVLRALLVMSLFFNALMPSVERKHVDIVPQKRIVIQDFTKPAFPGDSQ